MVVTIDSSMFLNLIPTFFFPLLVELKKQSESSLKNMTQAKLCVLVILLLNHL